VVVLGVSESMAECSSDCGARGEPNSVLFSGQMISDMTDGEHVDQDFYFPISCGGSHVRRGHKRHALKCCCLADVVIDSQLVMASNDSAITGYSVTLYGRGLRRGVSRAELQRASNHEFVRSLGGPVLSTYTASPRQPIGLGAITFILQTNAPSLETEI